ncbi:MAG: hypothetical protein QOD03_897 [Verrucomicrobiota bacterium]
MYHDGMPLKKLKWFTPQLSQIISLIKQGAHVWEVR